MRPLKVLMSAYACEPGRGSEPGVGWSFVQMAARHHQVWVLTRANNRTVIEQALTDQPLPNVHWVYFDLPRWARFWKKGQRGVHLYYYLWQIGAYRVARRLHQEVGFDLTHHVTFGNYWLPSFLSLVPVPFVWGPVGGGESAPRPFYRSFSPRGKIYEHARDVARWLGEHDPFTLNTAHKAAMSLAKTQETASRLTHMGSQRVIVLSEVALNHSESEHLNAATPPDSTKFRLISIGRLLHLKGFHLGIQAFARAAAELSDAEYWIVGDGPERLRLEALASRLGVADRVRFWGALSRDETLAKLVECDVLIHPSLHDSGGWVCVEAMAAGRPVICLDLGGPALQVTDETGIKVPATTPEDAIQGLAEAIVMLGNDPSLRAHMGAAGRRRVGDQFTTEQLVRRLQRIYAEVVGGTDSSSRAEL